MDACDQSLPTRKRSLRTVLMDTLIACEKNLDGPKRVGREGTEFFSLAGKCGTGMCTFDSVGSPRYAVNTRPFSWEAEAYRWGNTVADIGKNREFVVGPRVLLGLMGCYLRKGRGRSLPRLGDKSTRVQVISGHGRVDFLGSEVFLIFFPELAPPKNRRGSAKINIFPPFIGSHSHPLLPFFFPSFTSLSSFDPFVQFCSFCSPHHYHVFHVPLSSIPISCPHSPTNG